MLTTAHYQYTAKNAVSFETLAAYLLTLGADVFFSRAAMTVEVEDVEEITKQVGELIDRAGLDFAIEYVEAAEDEGIRKEMENMKRDMLGTEDALAKASEELAEAKEKLKQSQKDVEFYHKYWLDAATELSEFKKNVRSVATLLEAVCPV